MVLPVGDPRESKNVAKIECTPDLIKIVAKDETTKAGIDLRKLKGDIKAKESAVNVQLAAASEPGEFVAMHIFSLGPPMQYVVGKFMNTSAETLNPDWWVGTEPATEPPPGLDVEVPEPPSKAKP